MSRTGGRGAIQMLAEPLDQPTFEKKVEKRACAQWADACTLDAAAPPK